MLSPLPGVQFTAGGNKPSEHQGFEQRQGAGCNAISQENLIETQPGPPVEKTVAPNGIRKQTIFRLNETAVKQLDYMALDLDTSRQALLTEALNDFFKKHGKPPIA